jgi:hypothetical protein
VLVDRPGTSDCEARLTGMPLPVVLASMNRRSVLYRSLIVNPGMQFYLDPHRVVARNLEVPSGGGVGTAHALAKAYGVFANGCPGQKRHRSDLLVPLTHREGA